MELPSVEDPPGIIPLPLDVIGLNVNGNAPPTEAVGPSVDSVAKDPSAEIPKDFPIF